MVEAIQAARALPAGVRRVPELRRSGPQTSAQAWVSPPGDVAPPRRGLFYGTAVGDRPEVSVRVTRMTPQQAAVVHRGNAVQWQQQQQ